MQIFLDTADATQIGRYLPTGLFSGVTSNPAILKAAGLGPTSARKYYESAVGAGAERVFLQTFGATFDDQLAQAMRYRDLGPEVVVKIVSTGIGAAVARHLENQGITTLLTAVHDSKQTITAMAAGATYIAPYLSEMYASGRGGIEQVLSMLKILHAAPGKTNLVMAGFQDIATMVRLAEAGMRYLSITPTIADMLFAQPETEAMSAFFDSVSVE